jgi:thiamine pyrophosphokinase
MPQADLVVAADSGADLARSLGSRVNILVGDLDSISDASLCELRSQGTRIDRHHPDKDATDLELALTLAVADQPRHLILVGGHGGRFDHALATVEALATVAAPGRRVEAWLGKAQLLVTGDDVSVAARVGELVSVLPVRGAAEGVTTTGLRWALEDATLPAGTTRGVSNEVRSPPARITLTSGTLAVIRPFALAPEADPQFRTPSRPSGGPIDR